MIRKIIAFFLCLYLYFNVFAQQNMTLYQMHDIAQSNSLNPSVASDCRWNVGFPLLGNISVAVGAPFSYNNLNVTTEYNENDINVKYLDGNKILSSIQNINLVSSNISLNILTIGYRMNDFYFQFTADEKVSAKLSFSKDLAELFLKGNGNDLNKTFEASLALSLSHYREYGFNVAYDFGDDLWLGARAKLLFGRIGANSLNNTLSLTTNPDTYALELNSDLLVDASFPGTVETDADGTVSKLKPNFEVTHFVSNPVNIGGAIDLGMNKTFESGLKISASILNIGMINWSKNTHRLSHPKSALLYSGATGEITNWGDFSDTLLSVVSFKYDKDKAFSQWLTPEVMIGASYPVMEYMRAGVTGYAGISSTGIPWAFTLTALTDNTSNIFGALSYTVTQSSFVNIGAGLGFRFGIFNLHLMTDNIISLFNFTSEKYATLQFGINFKFGCGETGNGRSRKQTSIPCPAFGHSARSTMKSVPCSSGK
jgi:hypothetical protein